MASPVADTYSAPSGVPVYGGRYGLGGQLSGEALLAGLQADGGMGTQASELSGAAALAGVTAGGGMGILKSERTALVGDSLTALSYGPLHPYTWANGIAGGALKFVANCGVASDTIQDVINRIDNSYTSGSPGLAGLSPLGRVFLRIGTNNFRGGTGISGGTESQYITLFGKLLTYCSEVIVFAVPPVGSPENGSGIPSVNAWLSSYCAANPSTMKFINDCVTVDNGSGDWATGYVPFDGVHFSNTGSCQIGFDGGAALAAHLSGYSSPLSTDPADKYPAQPQWVDNHVNAGSGVPTGWSLGSYGSGFASSGSLVAADVADPNQVPWFRVTPTQVTAGSGAYLAVECGLSGAAITTSVPDVLELLYEIRFNAFDSSKFKHVRMLALGNNNEELCPPMFLHLSNGTLTRSCVARQAIRRSGTRITHTSCSLVFALEAASSFTGGMGTFDLRCLTIRG